MDFSPNNLEEYLRLCKAIWAYLHLKWFAWRAFITQFAISAGHRTSFRTCLVLRKLQKEIVAIILLFGLVLVLVWFRFWFVSDFSEPESLMYSKDSAENKRGRRYRYLSRPHCCCLSRLLLWSQADIRYCTPSKPPSHYWVLCPQPVQSPTPSFWPGLKKGGHAHRNVNDPFVVFAFAFIVSFAVGFSLCVFLFFLSFFFGCAVIPTEIF